MTWIRGELGHGDRKSPKDRLCDPFQMAMKMAFKWGWS